MSWRAARVGFAQVAALEEALGLPEPVAWTLVRRGLGDPAAAREFLAADGPLAPPEDLAGIGEAADRLARAVRGGERIAVHGDYDCDGVSSTAVLVSALRGRGGRVEPFLPSRFTEGYGVAESTVERLAGGGARLLVCVNCGTSAVEALTRAVELGMEPIVLDHHLAGGRRPPGILANPALGRPAEDLPAAVGVVHMLVRALAARFDDGALAPDPDDGIDLVALATVADAVPLTGDNRRRVARGLRAIRERPRPGIAALCAAAEIEPRTVGARTLGFTLAPCINAAGRLAHADRALELLLAPDRETRRPDRGRALGAQREAARGGARDRGGGHRPARGRARRDPRRGRHRRGGRRLARGRRRDRRRAPRGALRAPRDRARARRRHRPRARAAAWPAWTCTPWWARRPRR